MVKKDGEREIILNGAALSDEVNDKLIKLRHSSFREIFEEKYSIKMKKEYLEDLLNNLWNNKDREGMIVFINILCNVAYNKGKVSGELKGRKK